MKNIHLIGPFKPRLRTALALAVVSAALAPLALATAAEDKGETASKTDKPAEQSSAAETSKAKPKIAPKKLSGAELYSMHCNRCHPERYPTERTAAQWKTILMHMRVRANLPAEQSRTILKYLQDNSGR
jgi:cytochrome c5